MKLHPLAPGMSISVDAVELSQENRMLREKVTKYAMKAKQLEEEANIQKDKITSLEQQLNTDDERDVSSNPQKAAVNLFEDLMHRLELLERQVLELPDNKDSQTHDIPIDFLNPKKTTESIQKFPPVKHNEFSPPLSVSEKTGCITGEDIKKMYEYTNELVHHLLFFLTQISLYKEELKQVSNTKHY